MTALAVEATPQALYRAFDAEGDLLYVGISLNPIARFSQHRADSPWWAKACTITIEHHLTREDVEAAERLAIKAEDPRHNVNRGMVKRTFYIRASLWNEAKALAEAEGKNISDIVRELLEGYVKRGGKR